MTVTPQVTNPADQWLGRGFAFPLRPMPAPGATDDRAGIRMLGGMELVRQSVETILDTEPGERVMEPLFGCGLRQYLMEPNTAVTRTAIRQEITTALTQWEPRIRLSEVTVSPGDEPALIVIDIAYVRLPDLRPDNLVYPFYLS